MGKEVELTNSVFPPLGNPGRPENEVCIRGVRVCGVRACVCKWSGRDQNPNPGVPQFKSDMPGRDLE